MDTQDDNSIPNGSQQQHQQLGRNLLLRLVNHTYLSLPLSNCFNYTTSSEHSSPTNKTAATSPVVARNSPDCPTLSRLVAREFCHVNWPRAKVIQQQHPSSGLVSNASSSRELKLNALLEMRNRTSIEQITLNTDGEQQQHENNLSSSHHLFRSTYFTVSPVLATSAILINFFIILIIIFNTKQKRSPLIRANSTGQNSLLLFQLSLTGLLLAGYVLMEDMSLKARLDDLDPPDAIRLHDGSNIQSTSFNHRQLPASTLITFNLDESSSSTSSSWTSENRNFAAQRGHALILEHSIKEPISDQNDSIWLIQSPSSARISIESVQLVLPGQPQHHQHQHKHHHQHARHQIREEEQQQQPPHQCDNFSGIPAAAVPHDKGLMSLHLPMLMRAVAAVYVWTVAALAYDRYYAIAHPLQYLRSFHNSRTPSFMTSTWLIAIVLSYILPLLADYRWFHSIDGTHPPVKARLMFVSNHQFMSSSSSSSSSSSVSSRRLKSTTTTAQHRPALFEEDNNRIFDQVLQNILDIWRVDNSQLFDNSAENEVESGGLIVDLATKLTQLALAAATEAAPDEAKLPVHGSTGSIHATIVVMLSLVTFVAAITIPLTIVSVCNISIYRIVKVHERRLSVSSGSNVAASTSNISNQQHRQSLHQRYRVADDRSDVLSVTSLLLRRFLKGSLFLNNSRAENISCSENDDEVIRASNNHRDDSQDCEKLLNADGPDLEMAKASPKRTVVRQNSQQILTKLHHGGPPTASPDQGARRHQSQHELPLYCPRRQRSRLKRKTSDHAIVNNFRRSSFTSQPGDHFDYDHAEQTNFMLCGDKMNNKPDNRLINQIKLAGLSFAGIAIQEPSFNYSGRLLDKSTSCSLSNLTHNHHGTNHCGSSSNQQQRCKTVSRCSVESPPATMSSARKSYVTLANAACKPQDSSSANKYSTRLVDNCSDDHLLEQQLPALGNCHHHSHHHRLTSTIGTKSAAFNALIWLVAGLLLINLAHYSLSAYLYTRQVGSSSDGADNGLVFKLESLLSSLLALSNEVQDQSASISTINNLLEVHNSSPDLSSYVSIWLAYSCRVIFLSMLLLNGWLYGIRSRLLRTNMRMVLKKYISRRQASIEINHRNRSISSIRSRDSSFIGLPHLCHGFHANQKSSANCLACLEGSDRASCKNLRAVSVPSEHAGQHGQHKTPATTSIGNNTPEPQSEPVDQNSGSRLNQANNSIRFMIGDYGFDSSREQADDSMSSTLQTAPASVTSSLNVSCRSLISSSIHSSQSAAFLLIEPKLGPESAPVPSAVAPNSPVVHRKPPLEKSSSSSSVMMKTSNHHASRPSRAVSTKRDSVHSDAPAIYQHNAAGARARRSSEVEVAQPEGAKCPQVKKSSSEFRIYVTAADHEPDLETRKVLANKTFGIGDGVDCAPIKMPSIRQRVDSMDSWCKELKQNLTKLLSSTSSNSLSISRLYHPTGQQQQQSNGQSRKHTDLMQVKSAATVANSQRRRAPPLIRSQSDDREMPAASWRNLFTSGEADHQSSPSGKRGSPMRSSLTMSNIEKLISCHRHRQQHSKPSIDTLGAKEGGSGGISSSQDRSVPPAHLKPPNFLKLMFDPNNGAAYPVASALSPIKECSSNHSYASSQSSLNNAANLIAAVAAAAANHQQTSGLANAVASEGNKRTDSRSCSSTSSSGSSRDR